MAEQPRFVKKERSKWEIDPALAKLGITLSKQLPTYDVPLSLIEPTEGNPNEMDDEMFNRLVEEMETTGIIDAIQLVPAPGGKFKILGGEHRWRGAQTLGWDVIPANILTDKRFIDEDLHDFLVVRMNVLRGDLNPDKFMKMYEDKAKKYGAEQLKKLFAFTGTDKWKKLTKGVEDSLRDAGVSKELLNDLKKKTKKIKTVDGLGAVLNSLFRQYGSDLVHSFMVFTHGKKEHLYVIMSDQAREAMEKVKVWCRTNKKDVNKVLEPFLERVSSELEAQKDGEKNA